MTYTEGLLAGYRWFDAKKVDSLFAFGQCLSYTTFEYSNLKLVEGKDAKDRLLTVEFELADTGKREAAEAAQVYIQDLQSPPQRPVKELKGLAKVSLKPGQKRVVSVPLERSAFAYYDPDKKSWVAEAGDFGILVGSSSRDIRLEGTFKLAGTTVEK